MLIRPIQEQATPAPDLVDDRFVQAHRYSGTSFTTAQVAAIPDMLLAYVPGRMQDNGSSGGIVIPALVDPLQTKGIAIVPMVCIPGQVESKTAHITVRPVRKTCGHQHS